MPNFTDRTLKSLRVDPGKKDRLLFDTDCPGSGSRVTARGTRSLICQWTDPGTRQKGREPLGVWGSITIEQARAAARARLGQVAKGIDPAAERRARKDKADAEKAEAALSLDALISDWAKKHLSQKRPRYAAEAVRALRYAFGDHLKQPASRLTRGSIISVLDTMAGSGKGTTAGRTMAYGRSMYAWATSASWCRQSILESPDLVSDDGARPCLDGRRTRRDLRGGEAARIPFRSLLPDCPVHVAAAGGGRRHAMVGAVG